MSSIINLSEPGRQMSAYDFLGLQWTTTPPTVGGFYWIKATIAGYDVYGVVQYPYANNTNVDKITHWLGPLPMPEPPKGE